MIEVLKKNHCLDYSEEKYGETMVRDTRVILNTRITVGIPGCTNEWLFRILHHKTWPVKCYQQNLSINSDSSVRLLCLSTAIESGNQIFFAIVESQIKGDYLSMAWMVPQYFIVAMGEVMTSILLLNFSYSEAPYSIKTILPKFRGLLTIRVIGN